MMLLDLSYVLELITWNDVHICMWRDHAIYLKDKYKPPLIIVYHFWKAFFKKKKKSVILRGTLVFYYEALQSVTKLGFLLKFIHLLLPILSAPT